MTPVASALASLDAERRVDEEAELGRLLSESRLSLVRAAGLASRLRGTDRLHWLIVMAAVHCEIAELEHQAMMANQAERSA